MFNHSRLKVSAAFALFLVMSCWNSARAGEYYAGGYVHSGREYDGYVSRSSVWYSSSCCYKRITRHESHYVRINPYWRHGYYEDHHYGHRYSYRYRPYEGYYRRGDEYVSHDRGYRSYDAALDVDGCVARRVRVPDGRGGWVWGATSRCY